MEPQPSGLYGCAFGNASTPVLGGSSFVLTDPEVGGITLPFTFRWTVSHLLFSCCILSSNVEPQKGSTTHREGSSLFLRTACVEVICFALLAKCFEGFVFGGARIFILSFTCKLEIDVSDNYFFAFYYLVSHRMSAECKFRTGRFVQQERKQLTRYSKLHAIGSIEV